MRPITLGSAFVRPFSLSEAPDALPVVQVFAGETLLGSASVALTADATRRYTASYTLPGSGIALGTIILMRVDWAVDSEDQPTSDLFAGYVAPSEVAHVSDLPEEPDNAGIDAINDRTSLIYALLQLTDSDVATLLARIAGSIRTAADDVTAETAQTTAVRSGLALEATSQSILEDTGTTLPAAIAGISSGGDAQQATLLLVKAKTDLLGTGSVTINSPVASDGTIPKIYQGDDYAGGRAISFTFNSGGFTIASSTSRFEAQPVEGNSFGADGTVTDNGDGTATLSIPITSAQSQLLQTGPVHWSALVITSSGGRQTVTSGKSPLETRKHE